MIWRVILLWLLSVSLALGDLPRHPFVASVAFCKQSILNQYDSLSRLTNTALLNSWGHPLDGYVYGLDALGLRTNITRELGLTTNIVSIAYDPIAEVTSWMAKEANNTPRQNEQLSYGYDAGGNLQYRTNNALVQTFTVDSLNQLSNVTRAGTLTVTGALSGPSSNVSVNGNNAQINGDFTFAAASNSLNDGTNTYNIVAENAHGTNITNILSPNLPMTVAYQYDANGNLTSDGTRSFYYDAENRLTNVQVTGQWRTGFLYDGLGRRRVREDYTWVGGSVWVLTNGARYICDGMVAIQERDTNNNVLVTYTRGLDLSGSLQGAGGIGGLLARTDSNGTVFYHTDGSGNVTALIDTNGNVVARYEYDAYGRTIGIWGPLAAANVYRFSSKEYDAVTGLYYYGGRYYDPVLQRWLNRDPIQEAGGINLYGFVHNNPVNNVDPYGLQDEIDQKTGKPTGAYNGGPDDGFWFFFTPELPAVGKALGWAKGLAGDAFHWLGDAGVNAAKRVGGCFKKEASKALPKPPGWQTDWEKAISSRSNTGKPGGESWWNPNGGEWHYHNVDPWHPNAHWDYNPWDQWNSPWQNIDQQGNVIPKNK